MNEAPSIALRYGSGLLLYRPRPGRACRVVQSCPVGFSVFAPGAMLAPMATLREVVMIKDGGHERAVKVTIDAPSLEAPE